MLVFEIKESVYKLVQLQGMPTLNMRPMQAEKYVGRWKRESQRVGLRWYILLNKERLYVLQRSDRLGRPRFFFLWLTLEVQQ